MAKQFPSGQYYKTGEKEKMDNKSGIIFNIVHGSFVDGYGVRTTVFLKGCPLQCAWCCNPEGQNAYPEIKFISSSCNECGRCTEICPVGAIEYANEVSGKKLQINRELCTYCEKCIEICHKGALEKTGKYITVGELMEITKKDEQFYRQSGGGVTIGGGEPTFQSYFTLAFIRECKNNYIHTAVDTCGHTLSDEGFAVLEEADLLLFDLKGINPEEHKKNTGVSNETILNNLCKLDNLGKPIIIRIPLIPGYNDSIENMVSTAKFLATLKSVQRVDIIPYHEYGKIKYEQLGKVYALDHVIKDSLTQDVLNNIKHIFEQYGLIVQFGG